MRIFHELIYNSEDQEEQTVIERQTGDIDITVFWDGKFYKGNIPKSVKLFVDRRANHTDYLANSISWPIVSKRFLDLINKFAEKDIQVFNAPVFDIGTKQPIKNFYIINVIKLLKCMDLERSKISWADKDKKEISFIGKYVFQAKKISSDIHILKPLEYPYGIFFSDELASSLIGKNLKGISFIRTSSV